MNEILGRVAKQNADWAAFEAGRVRREDEHNRRAEEFIDLARRNNLPITGLYVDRAAHHNPRVNTSNPRFLRIGAGWLLREFRTDCHESVPGLILTEGDNLLYKCSARQQGNGAEGLSHEPFVTAYSLTTEGAAYAEIGQPFSGETGLSMVAYAVRSLKLA